ncbi:MAG: heparinase II/III domain-containing protein [Anaerolineae bacterium]
MMTTWQAPVHPHLIATTAQVAQAKVKVARGFVPAVHALARSAELAAEAATLDLPAFDHSWFTGKTFEDWGAIYPQVTADCWYIPERCAIPALGAAIHYVMTGTESSLESARRVLAHFANTYRFEIDHYDVGMDYAGWGLSLLYAYDLLYDQLSVAERSALDHFFTSWELAIEHNDREWTRYGWGGAYNNHYAWHKQAIANYGLFYNRPDLVEYCFDSPMGLRTILDHSLVDDGLWFESSTHYNFTAGHALIVLARCMRNSGWPEDLFAVRYGPNKGLRPLYDAALGLLFPDAIMPNVGDCYGHRAVLPVMQYEYAYAVYGDPRYAWVLAQHNREGKGLSPITGLFVAGELGPVLEPRIATRSWNEHGYALLTQYGPKGYFGDASAACFFNYGYSGVHNNSDRFSLELYAAGQRWLVDAESSAKGHSFSANVQRELNRSTLCHNLVSVDAHDQKEIAHPLKVVAFAPDVPRIVVGDDGELYAGVSQTRNLELLPTELRDYYVLWSDDLHQFDYQIHFNPGVELELDLPWQPAQLLGAGVEYTWVRDAVQAALESREVIFTARQNGRTLKVILEVPANATLIRGNLPRTQDFQPPHNPFIIVRVANVDGAAFKARFCWEYDQQ